MNTNSSLDLAVLRTANLLRLPLFKNKHGAPAHSIPDGSDWSPGQWIQAMIGEVGEFCTVRLAFERGQMPYEEYKVKAAKELADIQTYFSILCLRALDATIPDEQDGLYSAANCLMSMMAQLGEWANDRKKYERGDLTYSDYLPVSHDRLRVTMDRFIELRVWAHREKKPSKTLADPFGVDIGKATIEKFNEVSKRVGADVFITEDGRILKAEIAK